MRIVDVKSKAFTMPLTSPAFPPGPYRFVNREYLVITYETDLGALRAVVPEPLLVTEPRVKYEFIRMPDSTCAPQKSYLADRRKVELANQVLA